MTSRPTCPPLYPNPGRYRPIGLRPFSFFPIFCLAAALLAAQPTVGRIEVFGNDRFSRDKILKLLAIEEGAPLKQSRDDLETRLAKTNGIVEASVESYCCDKGKLIVYVGLEERGAAHVDYHQPATDSAELPEDVKILYGQLLDALASAPPNMTDNQSLGYSLASDPDVGRLQLQFLPLAKKHEALLRRVLRENTDEDQRSAAAYALGYAPKSQAMVNDLQFAMRDADPGVRRTAMRSLTALAVFAQKNKDDVEYRVQPTWFIQFLQSPVWSDRRDAALSLVDLTSPALPATYRENVLSQIRERALPALAEMSRWTHLEHALPGWILLGRATGLTETAIQSAVEEGNVAEYVKDSLKRAKKLKSEL